MYFDTHAHYDDKAFTTDRYDLLTRIFKETDVSLILNPGCDRKSSDMAVSLSENYPGMYAAVGWHPHDAKSFDDRSSDYILQTAAKKKVVAIGEIGLDYHYDFSPREVQKDVFRMQLALAAELNMPVIVHDREAHGDTLDIVREFPGLRGVFHCYSGSPEMAMEILQLGWYLSFTGVITFKNARKTLETIEIAPMDKIMLETDCPYLSPIPFRSERNDSSYLPYIAAAVSKVKNISPSRIAEITLENGRHFFGI